MSDSIILFRHSVVFFGVRVNVLHLFKCRLVMYIERDSRKTMPGKEQQGGSEYLSKCLDLLIYHIVRELPGILGKFSLLTKQILPFLTLSKNRYILIYTGRKTVFSDYIVCMMSSSWNFLDMPWSDISYCNAWFPILMFCVCRMVSPLSSVRNEAQMYKKFYWCSKDIVESINIVQSKNKFAP